MRWFHDMNTRSKLTFSFGLMFILLTIVVLTAYFGIRRIEASQRSIYEIAFRSGIALKDIRNNQSGVRASILEMALTSDPVVRKQALQDIKDRVVENAETYKVLEKRLEHDDEVMSRLRELQSIRKSYVDSIFNEELPLIDAGSTDRLRALMLGIQRERNSQMRKMTEDLIQVLQKRVEGDLQSASRDVRRLTIVFLLSGVVALAGAIVLTSVLNRGIAEPLKQLTANAQTISAGDFTAPISRTERHDEVGQLTHAFLAMNEYLGKVAEMAVNVASGNLAAEVGVQSERDALGRALRTMSEGLRAMASELKEAVEVIASSAAQILSSTTQVTASVTETASAVVETTTSIEEVRQTASVSNEKAEKVSEVSQRAVEVSQSGIAAVEEVAERMTGIRRQMESIAGKIVLLSEQSQSIGEIISTVNDLAEQSNLLAVNAAIEASKAGEYGKGFSVVAQEVKSLAEQSKDATAKIRSILNEIQKATSAAVLATEQGSKTVEDGVTQAARTGEAIRSLSANIAEAAEAAAQISASTQQQLVGMEQVQTAMDNIKMASEQNVAGTKQVEQSARSINDLGSKLKNLAARYRV